MHSFEGKLICGKRGGLPFIEAVRPDIETGECPEEFAPCSLLTSVEHTICYDTNMPMEDQCPITAFEFFNKNDVLAIPNPVVLDFVRDIEFAFSRDEDALPASTIEVERTACADPSY